MNCRIVTAADIPWIMDVGRRRYPHSYDESTMWGWIANEVLRHPHVYLALRTDDAFLLARIQGLPWIIGPVVEVLFVCAEEGAVWQAARLLRASKRWAEQRGASWRISSYTDFDLEPLALRLGARKVTAIYEIEWRPAWAQEQDSSAR